MQGGEAEPLVGKKACSNLNIGVCYNDLGSFVDAFKCLGDRK